MGKNKKKRAVTLNLTKKQAAMLERSLWELKELSCYFSDEHIMNPVRVTHAGRDMLSEILSDLKEALKESDFRNIYLDPPSEAFEEAWSSE